MQTNNRGGGYTPVVCELIRTAIPAHIAQEVLEWILLNGDRADRSAALNALQVAYGIRVDINKMFAKHPIRGTVEFELLVIEAISNAPKADDIEYILKTIRESLDATVLEGALGAYRELCLIDNISMKLDAGYFFRIWQLNHHNLHVILIIIFELFHVDKSVVNQLITNLDVHESEKRMMFRA
jgi:hypothetical protein